MVTDCLPKISVVIVYYKRRDTIEETLNSVLGQDYKDREVILVDNHSEDDIEEVVRKRGTGVRLVELPENLGPCGGRNAGIRAARGEFIVFLEDDASYLSPFELTKMMNVWETHPHIHVLAFQICDPDTGKLRLREWCHPRYWKEFSEHEFETHYFGEGAVAFRKEVFQKSGVYFEPFFIGIEGDDLSIRLLNQGFRILYTPQVRVGHRASSNGRSSNRQYYFYTRNYIWIAYKDFRFWDGVMYLVPKLAMMTLFAVRTRNYRSFFKGIRDGILGLKSMRPYRTPATRDTMGYLAELEKWRPGLRTRLARHRAAPQI
ncbi:MAG TPA: glycosyltransferase family 2 protein [Candidatus Acidoferrales bacterium]|nr:glycosyltransferase family 2 protein [Candidatus Acidoferrales bacterium]